MPGRTSYARRALGEPQQREVPLAAAASPSLFGDDFDRRCTRGLRAIIDGVACRRT